MAAKPGYKTTEFWLSLVAALVSFVYGSGILEATESTWDDRLVGVVGTVLAALGYSISRGLAKKA